jgi:hypothetical protein
MEATGIYWKPVWHILDDGEFELVLGNAVHVKNVPGRKTDVNDAMWLAELLAHGLIRASFVPDAQTQEMQPACNSSVKPALLNDLKSSDREPSPLEEPFGAAAMLRVARVDDLVPPRELRVICVGKRLGDYALKVSITARKKCPPFTYDAVG